MTAAAEAAKARRWEEVAADRLVMIERLVARIEEVDREYADALIGRRYADPADAVQRAYAVAQTARRAIVAPARSAGE